MAGSGISISKNLFDTAHHSCVLKKKKIEMGQHEIQICAVLIFRGIHTWALQGDPSSIIIFSPPKQLGGIPNDFKCSYYDDSVISRHSQNTQKFIVLINW